MKAKSSLRSSPLRIYVRRGALRRFHRLQRQTGELPVTIEWDRRMAGQAVAAEGDRRKAPPFTWELASFVVVESPDDPKPRRGQKSGGRKTSE